MNAFITRLLPLLAIAARSCPAAAQTSGDVPPAIWTRIAALGLVVDPVGAGKIYAQFQTQRPTAGVKRTLHVAYGADEREKLDVYEPSAPASKPAPMPTSNGSLYTQFCHRDNQCPTMLRFLMHDHISAVAANNTGDETVGTPILDFVRAR